MAEQKTQIPVIKCLPRADFLEGLTFWCPFCRKWHLHGSCDGHRVAHCTGNTPLRENGYIIKKMSKAELKETRDAINQYLERSQ